MTEAPDDACWDLVRSLHQISTPGGFDRVCERELGGVPHVVSVRGTSPDNPVLLDGPWGPGTPLAPTAWMWQRPLEEYFTVVHYDQRGLRWRPAPSWNNDDT